MADSAAFRRSTSIITWRRGGGKGRGVFVCEGDRKRGVLCEYSCYTGSMFDFRISSGDCFVQALCTLYTPVILLNIHHHYHHHVPSPRGRSPYPYAPCSPPSCADCSPAPPRAPSAVVWTVTRGRGPGRPTQHHLWPGERPTCVEDPRSYLKRGGGRGEGREGWKGEKGRERISGTYIRVSMCQCFGRFVVSTHSIQ